MLAKPGRLPVTSLTQRGDNAGTSAAVARRVSKLGGNSREKGRLENVKRAKNQPTSHARQSIDAR
jgi:hypothetical protein